MKTLKEIIEVLPISELIQLTKDYEQFERDGSIGDCFLRQTSSSLVNEFGIPPANTILWMDRVAFEAYRALAKETIEAANQVRCGSDQSSPLN